MEKRRHIRANPFELIESEVETSCTRILDVSAGGVCIKSQRHVKPGKRLIFSFALTDTAEEVEFLAEVRWVKPDGKWYLLGLNFLNWSPVT